MTEWFVRGSGLHKSRREELADSETYLELIENPGIMKKHEHAQK